MRQLPAPRGSPHAPHAEGAASRVKARPPSAPTAKTDNCFARSSLAHFGHSNRVAWRTSSSKWWRHAWHSYSKSGIRKEYPGLLQSPAVLVDRLRDEGRRLFRRRSVVPLALLPFVALALPDAWRVAVALGPPGNLVVQWGAFAGALVGQVFRTIAVSFAPDGTSSRDTHQLRAPVLNTTGIYSLVRHPLYLGNAIVWVGVSASLGVWWLVVIVALVHWIYIERVMLAEEDFLEETFGDAFRAWASRTPAFLPRLSGWVPASGGFSWRRLAAEHNGFLAIALAFAVLQWLVDLQIGWTGPGEWMSLHPGLIAALLVSLAVSAIAVIAKRIR